MRVGRRTFLTQLRDPQGQTLSFTYDAQLRLIAVTDAIGQVTALTYAHATDPLKITQVTDPFGRSATLAYDAAGRLAAVTDVIGLTSRFGYDTTDFINALTTPYGTTSFRREHPTTEFPFTRWIEATDPLGATERLEYRYLATPGVSPTAPASEVPSGILVSNGDLDRYNSYYWDKRAHALYPGDYSKAIHTHWLFGNTGRPNDPSPAISIPHSRKMPLESRTWYRYQGQVETMSGVQTQGVGAIPAAIGRVLAGGITQAWVAAFNAAGRVTSRTDPLGRRTSYVYAANGLDLAEVRQTTGAMNDLLAVYGEVHDWASVSNNCGRSRTKQVSYLQCQRRTPDDDQRPWRDNNIRI